jgi:hypothetical protein
MRVIEGSWHDTPMGNPKRRGLGIAALAAMLLFVLGVGVTIIGNWATAHQPAWLESALTEHQTAIWIA